MIVSKPEWIDDAVKFDIGRPSYYNENDFASWGKLFDFIENCDTQIAVSNVYRDMREFQKLKQVYCGGGFSFAFWFKSRDDRNIFLDAIAGIFPQYWNWVGRMILQNPDFDGTKMA